MASYEKRLNWTKKAPGEWAGYLIHDPDNELVDLSTEPVAIAVRSGSRVDSEPWDWYITDHGNVHVPDAPKPCPQGKECKHGPHAHGRYRAGVTSTLRAAKGEVEMTLALPEEDGVSAA